MRICKWKTTRSDGNRNGVFPQIVIWFLATVQKPPARVAQKIDGISLGGQKWRNPPGRSSFGFPFWEISKISACSVIVPMRTTSSDRNWSMSSGETVNRSSKSSPPLRAISSVSSGSVNAAIKFGSIGICSASIKAPTPLDRQMCARSDERPSLISIIDVTIPNALNCLPSST